MIIMIAGTGAGLEYVSDETVEAVRSKLREIYDDDEVNTVELWHDAAVVICMDGNIDRYDVVVDVAGNLKLRVH